ncbi:oligosaccharide flippase family protein [Qipengyuania sp. DGS5-3]|uniref:oligosaccharide flippase family protein n=1 Tax=Qipengyuania sp. DGS5-3 TaxID=3349632 RepID=UPI0036D286D4
MSRLYAHTTMTASIPILSKVTAKFRSNKLFGEAGWVAAPFATNQVLRLGTNIVLAGLLAPEIFGLMLLVNTLRTGAELLSDIGIGQSVVRSPNGEDTKFLNVAWTLQVLRGVLLTTIALVVAYPVAQIYERPELFWIMLAVSPIFLITGFHSVNLFLIQRRLELKKRAVFDTAYTVFHCGLSIILAILIPNVWALVIALVASTTFTCVLSYLIGSGPRPSFQWDKAHVHEIVNFGKWIFLSTAVYFAATSYDRLYFVDALPLALAGVYAVARSYSEVVSQVGQRAGAFLVFPKVAAIQDRRHELAGRIRSTRFKVLALLAVMIGGGMAISDQFILFAYDERYHAAAFILPILLYAIWFSTLSTFSESMLMGCGKPAPGARANLVKFAVLLVVLPIAMAQGTLLTALGVLIGAEVARWAALVPAARHEGFAKYREDILLSLAVLGVAGIVKLGLGALGLVPSPEEWWAMEGLLNG